MVGWGEMSSFVRETEGATSRVKIYDDKVVKTLKQGSGCAISTSLKALNRLKNEIGFPRVLDSRVNSITLTNCGESLLNLTKNEYLELDPLIQMYRRVCDIRKHGIEHRDINERNWLVKDGVIYLIDFSWVTFDDEYLEPPHGTLGMWQKGDAVADDWAHAFRCHKYYLENLK